MAPKKTAAKSAPSGNPKTKKTGKQPPDGVAKVTRADSSGFLGAVKYKADPSSSYRGTEAFGGQDACFTSCCSVKLRYTLVQKTLYVSLKICS